MQVWVPDLEEEDIEFLGEVSPENTAAQADDAISELVTQFQSCTRSSA